MIERIFNLLGVRILIGAFIGLPITALALIGLAHGLVFLYSGVSDRTLWAIVLGVLSVVGTFGVIGAWLRITISSKSMSKTVNAITRFMLFCGLITSTVLGFWWLANNGIDFITVFFVVLTSGAVLFIYATPICSNKPSNLIGADNVTPS